ncbi:MULTISPECIES: DUF5689 domain-containing protein [unclassified Polaribacter]|uniref:DUF5689 domain-containing protein n=1 Tax=unclassified Polaribacter TaxID=196858 RepID=UPI0011BE1DDB|nr:MULTISPECIES: DUF5689 domain-containing protein [unclassified Polaribacter]TXD51577.1 hypothetical protein ES043_11360 [Polaribacter sp. IC063]TXD61941.1 hypothetical protein ES044_02970 [Polaribacter sp. IC066]
MKTYKISILIVAFFTSIFLNSCVEDGDFSVPKSLGNEENTRLIAILDSINNKQLELKSIRELKELYISGNEPLKISSNIVVKGYVISSDQKGNYFREFYMQDAPENPTAGIKIAVNLNNNYNKFNIGREVYIYLKDLYIGETNAGDGIIAIGGKINATNINEVQSITTNQIRNHLYRSAKTEIIVPKIVSLAGLNASDIGTFVQVQEVIFPDNLLGKAYVDPTEDFDTQRKIQTCQTLGFADLLVETSSFARFANERLPVGGGTMDAVVSKDFGGDFLVLVLNSSDDVSMDGDRCVTLSEIDFPLLLLDEGFEDSSGEIAVPDWINYREAGTKSWRSYSDTYSQSIAARVGSRNSGDASTVTWLITKGVNLDATAEEFLSFETSSSFSNGSSLEVLISVNWNGIATDINIAEWNVLPAKIVADGVNFKSWIHSTYINLSDYSGIVFIAFKYTGTGNINFDGTYELDNIKINAR